MTIAPVPTPGINWAAAIPAGINMASSLFGGGKEKRPKPSETSQFIIGSRTFDQRLRDIAAKLGFEHKVGDYIQPNVAQAMAEHLALSSKMASAKQLGINPLMALGMPSHANQSYNVKSAPADDTFMRMASAGADFSRSLLSGQSNLERLQERLLTAQIEGQEIDNVSRASQIARTAAPGVGAGLGGRMETLGDPRYPDQSRMPMGYGDTAPFWRIGRDANGDPIRVYNDELGDNDTLQMLTSPVAIFDAVGNLGRRVGRSLRLGYEQSYWGRSY